jgi:predicted DNA binding protein
MRILKLKISSDFLEKNHFPNYFTISSHIEMLQIYQYDISSFFSMQRIMLKPNIGPNVEEKLIETFQPKAFKIIEQKKDEILCIMKQDSNTGFWPLLLANNWALIPPIIVDEDYIKLTVLTREENVNPMFDTLRKQVRDIQLEAVGDAQSALEKMGTVLPKFTPRQIEIATYAFRKGFFESPRKITAEELASKFSISVSAVNEHLRKTEYLVMKYFFS